MSNQGNLHSLFEAVGGVNGTDYNEAVLAACAADSITEGSINEQLMQYLQNRLNSTKANINDLKALTAERANVKSWFEVGNNPLMIPNLVAYFDASDSSTITSASGAVSAWADKSGNGNNAIQGTGSAQPITDSVTVNNLNALSFDGTDFMTIADNASLNWSNLTIGLVVRATETVGSFFSILSKWTGTGNQREMFLSSAQSTEQVIFRTSRDGTSGTYSTVTSTEDFIVDQAQLIVAKHDSTNTLIRVDTNENTSPQSGALFNGSADLVINGLNAAASLFEGDFCEIFIYDRALTTVEIRVVENYLSNKWGTS